MCGIVGIVNGDDYKNVDARVVYDMCDTIVHRGPDDHGYHVDQMARLGMRRLSIIDVQSGKQPVYNEDGSVCVVFNGEIYNYGELRKDLINKKHIFYTSSDTEVIVHLYEEYGENCVRYLNGMFAFAIWDARQKKLMLARDRLGKKPVYYSFNGKRLVFASELKSLLRVTDLDKSISFEALDYYLTFGCVPGELSILNNVYKLPSNHVLIYQNNSIQIHSYWNLGFGQFQRDRGESYYIEALKELFFDSVKLRLASDVPLGAFLSGGLDSSTVVAAMIKLGVHNLKTFTIGFDDEGYSEVPQAREVANFLGTNHQELIVKPEMTNLLPDLVWFFDEPFADSSAVPTYYVSKLARSEVTVVLSGDGGDELFAGYTRYVDPPLARTIQRLPATLRLKVFNRIAASLPVGMRGAKFLKHCSGSPFDYYTSKINYFDPDMKSSLYSQDLKQMVDPELAFGRLRNFFNEYEDTSILSRRQYTDIRAYLVDTILTKVDRASMATSLEARAPFLDYRIVEFAGRIPDHYKIINNSTKHLLKKMAKNFLPEKIIERRKKGFSIPKHNWIRDELKEYACDVILSTTAKNRGYFNFLYVQSLLNDHFVGKKDYSDQIWALLWLELWHREYTDKNIN